MVIATGESGYGEVRNLDTNEATMISDPEQDIQGAWMTDRYVSWAAEPAEVVPGWGRDTHYLDLETWEVHRITSWGSQLGTCVDGHRIVWGDTRRSGRWWETGWEGWDVYLYDIETGEERLLSDDPYDQLNPYIRGDLVVWDDYRYTRGWRRDCLSDVYVYDISTGIGRRVTSVSWWWTVASPVYHGKVLVARYPPDTSRRAWQLCFFDLWGSWTRPASTWCRSEEAGGCRVGRRGPGRVPSVVKTVKGRQKGSSTGLARQFPLGRREGGFGVGR